VATIAPVRAATECKIVFRSNRGGSYTLWVYDIASGIFHQIPVIGLYPSWSSDGTHILYLSSGYYLYYMLDNGSETVIMWAGSQAKAGNVFVDGRIGVYLEGTGLYRPHIYQPPWEQLAGHVDAQLSHIDTFAFIDCVEPNCVTSNRHYTDNNYYIHLNNVQVVSSSTTKRNAVIYGSHIYYENDTDIRRIRFTGVDDELFLLNAQYIRFDQSSGYYTYARNGDIYYSDGSTNTYRITDDSADDSQPDIYCKYINEPTPTPVYLPGYMPGYTLPTATAHLTGTAPVDYQSTTSMLATGTSTLFDFDQPTVWLLTILLAVGALVEVGRLIKLIARWSD
jgi:hypothetical protein